MSKNDKMDFGKLFAAMTAVFKAVPADKLADLNDALDHQGAAAIPDMFNEAGGEHKAPSRAEVNTGPAESMRSGGAEPMINRYSDFAPQGGLTQAYERFEKILSDFAKSMKGDFDRRFTPLADVVSDLVKNQAAVEGVLKSFQDAAKGTETIIEDTFFGKAQMKLEKAKKAFRKAEMEEDEESREERKSRLTEVNNLLKSALKLISKADDEEKHEDEEVEKAVAAVKALQTKVSTALGVITKAEEDEAEEKKEEEAEKARAATEATAKAEDTEEEEKKDDTAKAVALTLDDIKKSLEGLKILPTTIEGFMQTFMAQSKGAANLATPPNLAVIKGGLDPQAAVTAAIDSGELTGRDVLTAQTLLGRRSAAAQGAYPEDKLNADIAAAPASVRKHFA